MGIYDILSKTDPYGALQAYNPALERKRALLELIIKNSSQNPSAGTAITGGLASLLYAMPNQGEQQNVQNIMGQRNCSISQVCRCMQCIL